ncbi:MAG: molecular chaperone HtpG [Clostridiaceae bacterium]|nr:molecular chaperone HtpG [Clostridiaceae bacterium]
MNKKGKISVTTENIFPIIRQWLYSSQDIFLREIVSNGVDAITKRQHLANLGQVDEFANPRIDIVLDQENRTLTVSDNGIGMTAEEVEKYINEIAYSGLVDFVEKYQDEGDPKSQIIGHFGLGFYSAFMVADKVEIQTKSCFTDQPAVHWQSEEGIEFEMTQGQRETAGTDIVMHLTEEAAKQYNEFELRAVLKKYCQFMQYPIYLNVLTTKDETEEAAIKAGKVESQTEKTTDEVEEAKTEQETEKPINNPDPLWNKRPAQVEKQEYIDFYYEVFPDGKEPLFWVHLNLDYPFRVKGILYFPKLDLQYERLEGRIKVFYNQVYVADNIPEIIPEFLFLLRGCIDCPDLPLNVSRSFLQDDQYVRKLSSHIVKKVSDRLSEVYRKELDQYKEWWQYLQLFVKYGMMSDRNFSERVQDIALLKDVTGEYTSLKDVTEGNVYYTPGENELSAYTAMAQQQGKTVYVLDQEIDLQWMSYVEFNSQGKIKFVRVDAEPETEQLNEKTQDIAQEQKTFLTEILKKLGEDQYEVKYQASGTDSLPLLIRESEEFRRMNDFLEQVKRSGDEKMLESMQQMLEKDKNKPSLIVNTDQPLLERLETLNQDQALDLINYFLKLAKLGQDSLQGTEFIEFLELSAKYAFESTERDKN